MYPCVLALCNISTGTAKQAKSVVDAGAISPLISLLGSAHTDLVELAIRAMGNIADHEGKLLNKVVYSLLEISKQTNHVR